MITAREFIGAAAGRGFSLYTGVPCSYLTPFINQVLSDRALRYVGAVNEGDAVAIAAAPLGGRGAIAMFQNSGLGNAVNPLTATDLPVAGTADRHWRGQPGGAADEPQHELMGEITPRCSVDYPRRPFPSPPGDRLDAAARHSRARAGHSPSS